MTRLLAWLRGWRADRRLRAEFDRIAAQHGNDLRHLIDEARENERNG
jgi:hypothetical protein